MSTATLAGLPCMRATVHLPAWGLWFADVELDQEATLSGAVELVLADVTFKGAVVSGGPWLGRSAYRIVGGSGGWCKPIAAKEYRNDAGVKVSTVIGDAAALVGETCEGMPAGTCGPAFDRIAGAASQVLQILAPEAWYVGDDGVTRFGRRAAHELQTTAARGKVDLAAGYLELMADEIATIVPGVIVEGVQAVDVVHVLDESKLRSRICGSSMAPTSKRLSAWRRLFAQLEPLAKYRGIFEYRVVYQNGERLDLQPVRASLGMPELRRVRVCPGVAGCRADITLGSLVLIAWINGDPSRPTVIGFDDADSPGFATTRLDLAKNDESGVTTPTGRVLRYGDTVQMPFGTAGTPMPFSVSPTVLSPGLPTAPVSRVRA